MKLWSKIIPPHFDANADFKRKRKGDIIFLHGTGSNSHMWKNQVTFFSQRGYTCTILDLRGHGATHEPYEPASLGTHIEDILHTLHNAGVNFPAYFVGHSLGAIISLAVAEKHPELVSGVFAACIPGRILSPVAKAFGLFIDGPIERVKQSRFKKHLGWRQQALVEMPTFTLKQIMHQFADIDLLNATPQVKCPVHLSCGRFDPIAVYWHIKKMHKQMPNSTFKMFEWGGHNFMDTKTAAFNAWIERYLEQE